MTFHTCRTHITVVSLLILVIITITAVTGARDVGVGVGPSYIQLPSIVTSQERKCEESYGFLPCTTTGLGNGFLIIVYGYIMYTGATYLSNGSELLLEVLGPGIIGGLFLPVLGALPDAMLILVSGLSGTAATAQDQVSVGMGLLAGSTVMLLTVIWGTCVIVGKCDLRNSLAVDETDTKGFNLLESGVSTDIWTSYAARIMAISVLPFLVVQLPQALHSTSGRHLAVLFALILSLLMLISYCVYQVFQPWIQVRRLNYVKHKRVLTRFLKHLKANAFTKLYNDDATPNIEAIEKIFEAIDVDKDGCLSEGELRAFVVGIEFEETNLKQDDFAHSLLKEFDTERQDDNIDLEEFKKGIIRLLGNVRGGRPSLRISETEKYIQQYDEEAREEHLLLGDEDDDESEEVENPKGTTIKAVLLLLLGTLIAAVFADPLVDAVDNFSDATSIPSFFISFIALPLATNSSEAVSSIIFASRKKRRSTSLTFSEIYGSVTMNNVLCLAVFLALVYVRGLTWDFSSEVLVIFLVCIIMGAIGSFRTTFPLWMSYLAFLLYPLSLVLVYVLDYVFGWS